MSSLDSIWKYLEAVQAVYFRATSFSSTNWKGKATGIVKVSAPSNRVLIFEESGRFQQHTGEEINFSNTFRWTRHENTFGLEHLRFGAGHPVFLFDMEKGEDGIWREIIAHPCRNDCYRATLRMENEILFMTWRVEGADRDEIIDYTYL